MYRRDPARSRAVQRYKNYQHWDKAYPTPQQTINRQDALELMSKPCHWCGETDRDRGLDRLNNERGHELDNVVPCCLVCNTIRGAVPVEAMTYLQDGLRQIQQQGLLTTWSPYQKGSRDRTPWK